MDTQTDQCSLALALMDAQVLPSAELNHCIQEANNIQQSLAHYLYEQQLLSSDQIILLCCEYYGLPVITPKLIDEPIIENTVAYFSLREQPCVAITDPDVLTTLQPSYTVFLISLNDFNALKTRYQPISDDTIHTSVIELLNQLIIDALKQNASDIHLEPTAKAMQLRYRIHGQLKLIRSIDCATAAPLIMRLKVIGKCDITQHRLAQDGQFSLHHQTASADCRLSICPTVHGEKAVIRLFDKHKKRLSLSEIGLSPSQQNTIEACLRRPQGLILVTGPTGCGKTQTLYSMLHHINHQQLNISTIEDPVEIQLPGINQISINPERQFDYAHILCALLRQDPDVIMVGEIRDRDTAIHAIRAAQTGHLVLSTLHTNDAISAIQRLRNLGIPAHDISSTLRLVVAQRLLPIKDGRHALFECFELTPPILSAIAASQTQADLYAIAKDQGFESLWAQGMKHVESGMITQSILESVISAHDALD